MAHYAVIKGQRYRAKIMLSGIETWAGNETIAEKFTEAGFQDVVVTGEDGDRTAEGTWNGEDGASAEIPEQVAHIEAVNV